MRALIVDDEPLARLELRRLLQAHADIEIAGEGRNAEEALALIRRTDPDLLFLDIEMPGANGFDLLERLPGHVPDVIFTTAFDRHAIRAFEVNALDYLLKPIAPERLAMALRRLHRQPRHPSRIFLRDGERCWIVRVSDVCLLESDGNYTRVHVHDETPLIRRSLGAFEAQLDPASFFRANRRQVVNLNWIEETQLDVDGALVARLRDGTTVRLSRRQSERLRSRLSP